MLGTHAYIQHPALNIKHPTPRLKVMLSTIVQHLVLSNALSSIRYKKGLQQQAFFYTIWLNQKLIFDLTISFISSVATLF